MIRSINYNDIDEVNRLLKEFNYNISKSSFEDSFFRGIVYEEETILGVLIYKEIYERMEIEYIVVDKLHRRSKIASKLMKELISLAQEKRTENISLEVNINNIKAINLYKKFDFKIVARRENYYNGEDGYLMVRR